MYCMTDQVKNITAPWLCGNIKLHWSFVCWTPKTHSHQKWQALRSLYWKSSQVYKPSESPKGCIPSASIVQILRRTSVLQQELQR